MVIAVLKKGKEKKLLNGYPWVFEDEISEVQGELILGSPVNVFSNDWAFVGKGLYNPFSNRKIMFLTTEDVELDENFFRERLYKALEWRTRFFDKPYYRLFHGEADGIPGFIADRYGEVIVVQFRNSIVELLKKQLVNSIVELLLPAAVYERSDFEMGTGEVLQKKTGLLYGEIKTPIVEVEENGLKYIVNFTNGQKTGFFFDQRDSRKMARKIVKRFAFKRALDLFSFTGGFGINMAKAGAEVVCVDKSGEDLEVAELNAALNDVKERMSFVQMDVFKYLKSLEKKEQFDIVVLDPPSLIKRRKELRRGIELLKELVSLSVPVVKSHGVICLCSCAYNLGLEHLIEALRKVSLELDVQYKNIGITYQSLDHPWVLQIPESLYLKCVWTVVEKR
ncbi:class I SAM-dependent rRNA methyltransferase [Kosmotoga sp. DU53]|uniref:class I SAM-dependent rRNA methyltransferase n=1 Tax=Kosmotoga sp. DU53 TaxID=1310160 RepID=UPI0007C4D2D9|nr:class I SAM-dependent rRNA methyltransferase [Kosmotoga sp. DU53]OAA22154.1 methyltransferase [Kosmotoga sp. DU53]